MIISGARIYFPPNNQLPKASDDMLTFAVVGMLTLSRTIYYLSTRAVIGSLPPSFFQRSRLRDNRRY